MYLQKAGNIIKMWEYAIANGADVVLMRHGPKSGSNNSDLSEQGRKITCEYGRVLNRLNRDWFRRALVGHTEKKRTKETVSLFFPDLDSNNFVVCPKLNSPPISEGLQKLVVQQHLNIGRWRGYSVNETYGLLARLDVGFPGFPFGEEEDLHDVNTVKVAEGIKELIELGQPVIFCGHSPNLELGVAKVLGVDLLELGGFLKPLDSIHLKNSLRGPTWIARINPIRDCIDLEREHYLEL